MGARQEDFVYAELVLRRGYASEEQVEECLALLVRLRGEMDLEESLGALLVKKGYLAQAQAHVIEREINPTQAGRPKNAIEGYRLLERVGSGAMGSVYKALHLKLDIPVALKVLRPALSSSRTQIERLKREAHLAARLSHPNIVRSLDVGESNGFHYLAMEFVEGTTVRDLLGKGPLKEKEALRLVLGVARGLEHAHQHGVIHRDVKPGNIMLTRDGMPKLADFGLARGKGPSDLTLEQASIGTPQYVAPEQMRRGSDATPRSDLFSLGASLYHMTTGQPPFHGESLGEIVQNVLACRFDSPEKLVSDLSLDTVYLIHRLMRANPRERYASATQLIADIEAIERGERVAPPDFLGDYQAYVKRRRTRRAALGIVAAVGLFLVTGFVYLKREQAAEAAARERRCRVANAVGAETVERAATVADLRGLVSTMTSARRDASDCSKAEVAELAARLDRTQRAAKALAKAEALRLRADGKGASFREILEDMDRLDPVLPGAKSRLAALRAEIAGLSEEEAGKRRRLLRFEVETAADAVREMRAFADDLEKRYLETPFTAEVVRAAEALEKLAGECRRLEETYGATFEKALAGANYRNAAAALDRLERGLVQARDRARPSRFGAGFLALFPDTQERADELKRKERAEWENILDQCRKEMEGRSPHPERAVAKLERFLLRSFDRRTYVEQEIEKARALEERLGNLQLSAFDADRRLFENRIRARRYVVAARGVEEKADLVKWLPGPARRYAGLLERARILERLNARFFKNVRRMRKVSVRVGRGEASQTLEVKGTAFQRAPGDDPDLFLVTARKQSYEVSLRDLERAELERIFAFRRRDGLDRLLLGHFYAAEAFRADRGDLYEAGRLRQEALNLLPQGDPLAADVQRGLEKTQREYELAERRAERADAELARAEDRKDHLTALARCRELLDLAWTNWCRPRLGSYRAKLPRLERLAAGGLQQLEAGVPRAQHAYDPESGALAITYTGKVWYPDAGQVPPDVANKIEWLESKGRQASDQFFRPKLSQELAPDERRRRLAELYERAKRQLNHWSANTETGDGGGYRPDEASLIADAEAEYYTGRRPLPIGLNFQFRRDRPWSVEFDVAWETAQPGYFAVAAGQIQGVLGFQDPDPFERGGMAGAAILTGAELDPNAHRKQLGELHWHLVMEETGGARLPRKGRKRLKGSEKGYIDRFAEGKAYHVKLERTKGNRILFSMRPNGVPADRAGPYTIRLEKKLSGRQIEKLLALPDGRTEFRFFGVLPEPGKRFVLRDVRVRGILEERDGR